VDERRLKQQREETADENPGVESERDLEPSVSDALTILCKSKDGMGLWSKSPVDVDLSQMGADADLSAIVENGPGTDQANLQSGLLSSSFCAETAREGCQSRSGVHSNMIHLRDIE
jgi:hypothetical protein